MSFENSVPGTSRVSGWPRALIPAASSTGMRSYPAAYEVEPGGFSLRQTFGIARRNWWVILAAILLTVGATVFIISREVPVYQAGALIRLNSQNAVIGDLGSGADGSVATTDPIASEIMVLQSRGILGEAVDREGFRLFDATTGNPATLVQDVLVTLPPEDSRELRMEFDQDQVSVRTGRQLTKADYDIPIDAQGVRVTVPSPPDVKEATLHIVPRENAIDFLEGSLSTSARTGTSGIDVTASATDPDLATRMVNAVVLVHQDVNAQTARQEATRRRVFLGDQLRQTDSLLTTAQVALSGFRSRHLAYSPQERFGLEQARLVELEMRQEELKGNRDMYSALLDRIQEARRTGRAEPLSSLMSAPGLASDPVVARLYGELEQYRSERDAAITGPWAKAPTHPDVQALNMRILPTEVRLLDAARSHISSLDAQIRTLGRLRGQSASQMSQLSGADVEALALVQQLESLRNTGEQLRAEYESARLTEAVEGGQIQIIHLASRAVQVPEKHAVKLALGLLVGLMVGGGAAFVREQLDKSINRREEIEGWLQVQSLAVIPKVKLPPRRSRKGALGSGRRRVNAESNGGDGKLASRFDLLDAEAYRVLRTNLIFSQTSPSLKTLVIASALPKEGKTFTAVNLAAVYAQQGHRVLLMDCDLRCPNLGRFFETSQEITLTNVLEEGRDPSEAILASGMDRLDVMPAAASSKASELLGSPAMKKILEDLSQRYDMVILDSPPILLVSDAAVLAATADGVLLVVRAGSTDRGAAQQAMDQLEAVGARVVGAVLNDPDSTNRHYGGNYPHGYYGHAAVN